MQILRVPPYDSKVLKLESPIEIPADSDYSITAIDMADSSEIQLMSREVEFNSDYTIDPLPALTISEINISSLMKYDTQYKLQTSIKGTKPFNNLWNNFEIRILLNSYLIAYNAYKNNPTQELLDIANDIKNSEEYIEAKDYYDNSVKSLNNRNYNIIDEQYFDVVRPYIDPNTHGTTASDVEAYRKNEELARAIIDSVCDLEFYYKKKQIETTGLGLDYIPIWADAKKIIKVYENNVLLYDASDEENSVTGFEIISDGSAITMTYSDAINRDESARILLPASPTDVAELNYSSRGFPKGWDYRITLEVGYFKVPQDIVRATELLIHDIECGKLDYYKRYIGAYNTDQFRIQFDKQVFAGTGNLIVDKILDKYRKPIEFVGVL